MMSLRFTFGIAVLGFALAHPVFAQELAYTEPPQLQNRADIKALVDSVTTRLFTDGKESRTMVWAKVRVDGTTSDVTLRDASGDTARDNFAMRVVQAMRWSPAKDSKGITETWVSIPVVITGKNPRHR